MDDTPKGNFPTFQVREADLAHHLANQQDAKKSDKDKKAEAEALPYDDNDEAKTPDWVYLSVMTKTGSLSKPLLI